MLLFFIFIFPFFFPFLSRNVKTDNDAMLLKFVDAFILFYFFNER